MEHFGKHLIRKATSRLYKIEGCSNEEIQTLMLRQGVERLPKIYREYLESLGKSGLLNSHVGAAWSYESLLDIKQLWLEELELYHDFKLPEDAFVLMQYGGFEYVYFRTNHDNDDCPVYFWLETDTEKGYELTIDCESLSEFLLNKGYPCRK